MTLYFTFSEWVSLFAFILDCFLIWKSWLNVWEGTNLICHVVGQLKTCCTHLMFYPERGRGQGTVACVFPPRVQIESLPSFPELMRPCWEKSCLLVGCASSWPSYLDFSSQVRFLCKSPPCTSSHSRRAAHMRSRWNISAFGFSGKINNPGEKKKKKGLQSCRPQRQEAMGWIRTKVSSILDNTSPLWGIGRLKTPLRCFAECSWLFFVSQPL